MTALGLEDGATTSSDAISQLSLAAPTQITAFDTLALEGQRLRPILVCHHARNDFVITGLALLVADQSKPFVDPSDVARQLSAAWFDAGEVSSMTAWAQGPDVSS